MKTTDILVAMGFIEQLVAILTDEASDDNTREYCTQSIYNLASSHSRALSECLRPELQLFDLLRERVKVCLYFNYYIVVI